MNRFKLYKWSTGIVVLLFGNIAFAQDTLSVEKAIATALNNNYDILLSKQDSASVAISNEYRDAVFLPTLNANSTLLYNKNAQRSKFASGKDTTRTGIHTSNINASLNLNWTLF